MILRQCCIRVHVLVYELVVSRYGVAMVSMGAFG